ncbi:glycoside hydrolase, putative [Bodo saltans]|uniref:Glycoside hydrolase, putative n=1 Tax=Bodo saltans TaxID=75058 RepID=A0A0S4KJX5_BODSA|nr:glycoside hydrolase, putative [Bodo saltans]|eukprot:CUI14711.1 glycoside hydrolase, putative [Bodo saltans]
MHHVVNPTSVSLVTFVVLVALFVGCPVLAGTYTITDAAGPARVFDGIGGLSGGGATSVLLWTYPQAERDAILDFLFKPNFGASLHILKVEIGGDAQSTDGAEPSHMHTPWDENYERGYEWWLMREAKKRNPNIKLYGLAWAYPQWVTCAPDSNMEQCTGDIYAYPNVTATYITKWIAGAKVTYGLDIDYVGCWNERPWNDTYLKTLRNTLDNAGFANTKIVAPDGIAPQGWGLANDVLASPSLADAIYAIGAHYPGTLSTPAAEQTGKPLWASEDDSTYNNNVGAGCWARILNQNYVNGNMTASIIWNLIASYMKGTNWYRAGLMSAMQPWVGSYGTWHANGEWTVGPMIWASAHTTQFSEPGTFAYLILQL